MKKAGVIGLSILVCVLISIQCGCTRKAPKKPRLENALVAKDFIASIKGESLYPTDKVYNKLYYGMWVKDAVKTAGIPKEVIKDIDFLKSFEPPKKAYALFYQGRQLDAYVVIDEKSDCIVNTIYESKNSGLATEYIRRTKPPATVDDIKEGMFEEEVITLIGKPKMVVDGATDLLQYEMPEDYYRFLYPTESGGGTSTEKGADNWVEIEFSKADHRVTRISWHAVMNEEK